MRRPNGYGTVTKMPGTRRRPYAVRIPTRDQKGRVKQKYLSYHATLDEAWQALEAYRFKLMIGAAPAPEDLGVTLQQVYDLWSARKYEKASPTVIRTSKASWSRLSRYASMPIRNLGIDHWQEIIDEDHQNELSHSLMSKDLTLMRALSKFSLQRDWIVKDYTEFVTIPAVPPKLEKGAFTDIQIAKLERLAQDGFPGADAALVLCYTGFRIGEFLALTPFSYDPKEHTLTGGSKSEAGKNRIIPIHPKIQPYIDSWLSQPGESLYQLNEKSVKYSSFLESIFPPIVERIDQPNATPHWCRHTFASRLRVAGAETLAIKRLMGHANSDITEHYTHTTIDYLRTNLLLIA